MAATEETQSARLAECLTANEEDWSAIVWAFDALADRINDHCKRNDVPQHVRQVMLAQNRQREWMARAALGDPLAIEMLTTRH